MPLQREWRAFDIKELEQHIAESKGMTPEFVPGKTSPLDKLRRVLQDIHLLKSENIHVKSLHCFDVPRCDPYIHAALRYIKHI
ncbi:MAG: hypothetical protein HN435_18505 [Nitrospinaceae bacterium]|jgi:hypothetical protein|nr:hypothetical protein [Nitrospinaceae bacterium]